MYKVFHVDATKDLTWVSNSWDFDVELLAKLVRTGFVPIEVPVHYQARTDQGGKKMRLRDVLTVVQAIIRFRL
jgi:hypothetical protein